MCYSRRSGEREDGSNSIASVSYEFDPLSSEDTGKLGASRISLMSLKGHRLSASWTVYPRWLPTCLNAQVGSLGTTRDIPLRRGSEVSRGPGGSDPRQRNDTQATCRPAKFRLGKRRSSRLSFLA